MTRPLEAAIRNPCGRAALAGALWFVGMAAMRLLGVVPHTDHRDDGVYFATLLAGSVVFALGLGWFLSARPESRKRLIIVWVFVAVLLVAIYSVMRFAAA